MDNDEKSKEAARKCSPPGSSTIVRRQKKIVYIVSEYSICFHGTSSIFALIRFRISAMFTPTTFVILLLALWSGLAFSQSGSQNASIPDCIRACDTQAIKASNCASEDQYCHCSRYATILDNIVPCVRYNSSCVNGTADFLSTYKHSFDIALTN
jgi:hypothetical protein